MHDCDKIATDAGQSVTSTLTTEAFGVVASQSGASANPYRFAGAWGYRDDGDAGLPNVGARYYDPQVGRFISRDPVLSEHPYLYCEHEPVMRVDPSGKTPVSAGLIVACPGVGQLVVAAGVAVGVAVVLIYLCDEWEKLRERLTREWQEKLKPPEGRPGTQTPHNNPPTNRPSSPGDGKWSWFLMQLLRVLHNIAEDLQSSLLPVWRRTSIGTDALA